MTVDYHEHTDGESTGPIHHERPPQRTAIVRIDGLPVGWAKVTQGPPEIGVRLLAHQRAVDAIPRVRIGGDHALRRLVRLPEEEPVPPRPGEARVRPREVLADRDAVEDGEPRHRRACR